MLYSHSSHYNHTVSILCSYCITTLCTHHIHAVCALCSYCRHTVHTPCLHCIHPAFTLLVQSVHTTLKLCSHCDSTLSELCAHSVHIHLKCIHTVWYALKYCGPRNNPGVSTLQVGVITESIWNTSFLREMLKHYIQTVSTLNNNRDDWRVGGGGTNNCVLFDDVVSSVQITWVTSTFFLKMRKVTNIAFDYTDLISYSQNMSSKWHGDTLKKTTKMAPAPESHQN